RLSPGSGAGGVAGRGDFWVGLFGRCFFARAARCGRTDSRHAAGISRSILDAARAGWARSVWQADAESGHRIRRELEDHAGLAVVASWIGGGDPLGGALAVCLDRGHGGAVVLWDERRRERSPTSPMNNDRRSSAVAALVAMAVLLLPAAYVLS